MRKEIIIFFILCFITCNNHVLAQNIDSFIPKGFEVNLKYENDFNNDKVKDVLLILNSVKENELLVNNTDSISKRRLIVLLGDKKQVYTKIVDKDNVVPCKECGGKCDNLYSDLSFSNEILSYTTCNFSLESSSYTISSFKLGLRKNTDFKLLEYIEKYYQNSEDEYPEIIELNERDFTDEKFDFYKFNFAQNTWINKLVISENNVRKLNDFAFGLYKKKEYSTSIIFFETILQKFPTRIVTYLNLADAYWAVRNQKLAKENYQKYVDLMKSYKKDIKKIPQYVWTRIK